LLGDFSIERLNTGTFSNPNWIDDAVASGYRHCLAQFYEDTETWRRFAALCWSHMTPEEREKYEHAS
jgi:hypothetical protein